ncbi:retinal pigment epithelial membrane protein [Ditylenchus destructor]|nr:retinal pigment epithelial membrane protein [Ditylenchus destructor]
MNFDFDKNFCTPQELLTAQECAVQGEIPEWLSVTLLRNGPGRFKFGKTEMRHWFDGMSYMQRYYFKDSKMYFSAKYLQSDAYKRNLAAERIVVSEFGTRSFPDPCKNIFSRLFTYLFAGSESTDNGVVNFLEYSDTVYAVTETPLMTKIDRNSLDTIEKQDLSKYISLHTCTAHHHMDSQGNVFNVGMRFGKDTSLVFVRTDNSKDKTGTFGDNTTLLGEIPLVDKNNPCYLHSFAMTENYLVVFESPLKMTLWKLMVQRFRAESFQEIIQWRDSTEYTLVHIFDYKNGKVLPTMYKVKPFFTFHHANAYEKDGLLFIDYCGYDYIDLNKITLEEIRKNCEFFNTFKSHLKRLVVPIEIPEGAKNGENLLENNASYCGNCSAILTKNNSDLTSLELKCETLCPIPLEFPRYNYELNTCEYNFVYGAMVFKNVDEPLTGIVKANVKNKTHISWHRDNEEQVCTEPIFVARPGAIAEDDGVILCAVLTFNSNDMPFILVLDAKNFKELARCYLQHKVPMTFHGITLNA